LHGERILVLPRFDEGGKSLVRRDQTMPAVLVEQVRWDTIATAGLGQEPANVRPVLTRSTQAPALAHRAAMRASTRAIGRGFADTHVDLFLV
jgi:hypothetical protein